MEESIAPVSAFELDSISEWWNRVNPLDPISHDMHEHRIRLDTVRGADGGFRGVKTISIDHFEKKFRWRCLEP